MWLAVRGMSPSNIWLFQNTGIFKLQLAFERWKSEWQCRCLWFQSSDGSQYVGPLGCLGFVAVQFLCKVELRRFVFGFCMFWHFLPQALMWSASHRMTSVYCIIALRRCPMPDSCSSKVTTISCSRLSNLRYLEVTYASGLFLFGTDTYIYVQLYTYSSCFNSDCCTKMEFSKFSRYQWFLVDVGSVSYFGGSF